MLCLVLKVNALHSEAASLFNTLPAWVASRCYSKTVFNGRTPGAFISLVPKLRLSPLREENTGRAFEIDRRSGRDGNWSAIRVSTTVSSARSTFSNGLLCMYLYERIPFEKSQVIGCPGGYLVLSRQIKSPCQTESSKRNVPKEWLQISCTKRGKSLRVSLPESHQKRPDTVGRCAG